MIYFSADIPFLEYFFLFYSGIGKHGLKIWLDIIFLNKSKISLMFFEIIFDLNYHIQVHPTVISIFYKQPNFQPKLVFQPKPFFSQT